MILQGIVSILVHNFKQAWKAKQFWQLVFHGSKFIDKINQI
jgi:hypothetical protein